MSTTFKHTHFSRVTRALATVALVALTGCAQNYVVLLPDEDGTLGKVTVTSAQRTTLLDQKSQGAYIGGVGGGTFTLSDADLAKDFGAALAASPRKPASYLLYFETGQAVLTEAAQADFPVIQKDIAHRPGADISVIGHTDTVGGAQANYELGLTRAKMVSELIRDAGISADRLSIESHGERNLLVKTPDETDEPRNRRVEVIVR